MLLKKTTVRLKNCSKSNVAFKFRTTVLKSCYMRPPGGILAPREILIVTVASCQLNIHTRPEGHATNLSNKCGETMEREIWSHYCYILPTRWRTLNFVFVAGVIKYGERTWVLQSTSSKKLADSLLLPSYPMNNCANFEEKYSTIKA